MIKAENVLHRLMYAVLSINFDVRNVLSHLEIADISERVRPNA